MRLAPGSRPGRQGDDVDVEDDYPGPTWAKLEQQHQWLLWGVFRGLATAAWWVWLAMGGIWLTITQQTHETPVRWLMLVGGALAAAVVLEFYAQRLSAKLARLPESATASDRAGSPED
jgi:hypothetical protein